MSNHIVAARMLDSIAGHVMWFYCEKHYKKRNPTGDLDRYRSSVMSHEQWIEIKKIEHISCDDCEDERERGDG